MNEQKQATPTIQISSVHLGAEEEELVLAVLRSGRLAQGPQVEAFEREFAAAHDATHAVAVNNGTTALVAALQTLQLQPGDEVITTPFSFVATLNAILEAGATARFADVTEDMTIDPESVRALIGPRTRAIMPVHLYGLAADLPALAAIAEEHGLAIVEDAAQAHGARIDGRAVGSFGMGCFSLYATKNIMCGEGGVITTNNDAHADRLRLLRNQGMRARYQYEIAGHNYRMTELQAAIALPQLRRLASINEARRANAATLSKLLDDIAGLRTPLIPAGREHVYHQYTVRIGPDAALGRDELVERLGERGITAGIYYPRLMHDYDCYRGNPLVGHDETPAAARLAREAMSLPVHPQLSASDLERIGAAMRDLLGARR